MTKYVIKVTATAKESNPNFAGETHIYYYGKNQCLLASKTNDRHNNLDYLGCMAKHYGYNRECDARKSYIYKTRNCPEQFWTNVTIIEKVEV